MGYDKWNIIGTVSNILPATVSMTSTNVWYTGATCSLPSGVWFLSGTIDVYRVATTAQQYQFRIYDNTGATALCSTEVYKTSLAYNRTSVSMNTIVSLSATSSILLQAKSSTSTLDIISPRAQNDSTSPTSSTHLDCIYISNI